MKTIAQMRLSGFHSSEESRHERFESNLKRNDWCLSRKDPDLQKHPFCQGIKGLEIGTKDLT